jgi:hypothetical protein
MAELKAARYADYAGRAEVAVRDEAAFEEMRQYLILHYEAADVTNSVADGGAVFDCLRDPGRVTSPSPSSPPTPTAPPSDTVAPPSDTVTPVPSAVCPTGTVPVRRVTLDDVVRFATLAGFLNKGPGQESGPPREPTPTGQS